MRHIPLRVTVSLTAKEHEYHTKRGILKKQSLWVLIQDEMKKSFSKMKDPEEHVVCEGNRKRTTFALDLPSSMERRIVCLAKQLGMTPGQLIYRLLLAPHLPKIIEESTPPVPYELP